MARRPNDGESGGVMVLVAVCLPVLLLFASFGIDVGNWFEHSRHLQLQADAAALAGAGSYASCLAGTNNYGPIEQAAADYAGKTAEYPGAAIASNSQVGGAPAANVHVLFNSTNYYGRGGATHSDGNACSKGYFDVKMTETDVPLFLKVVSLFGGATSVPYIDAHARVSILQETGSAGALPIAVPDNTPQNVWVQFVNEDTGQPIGAIQQLQQRGVNGSGQPVWDNSTAPRSLTIPAPPAGTTVSRIGIRAILSGNSSSTCGTFLVECDDQLSNNGLLFAQGWCGPTTTPSCPAVGTNGVPKLRDVSLFSLTCDAYFSNSASTCTEGVRAKVDIGSVSTSAFQVYAQGGNCPTNGNNHGCQLQFQTSGANAGYWISTGNGSFPYMGIATQSGPNPVSIFWRQTSGSITGLGTCNNNNNDPCQGLVSNVQRTFAATPANSGGVQAAQLLEAGTATLNSFAVGSTHSFVVQLALAKGLANATSVSDPPVDLRVVGSQNQSIDCDPAVSTIRQEIAQGCAPQYTINLNAPCPAYNVLWTTPQPWFCVKTQTGGSVGQVTQGMDDRILQGGTCAQHPNNWAMFPNLPAGDTRIVPVFVTPFGTFTGSGNDIVHVTNFATFYVTGWGHNGNGNGCPGDDVPPSGFIVGHFIKYIQTINTGGGTTACVTTSFGTCVAVLTQ